MQRDNLMQRLLALQGGGGCVTQGRGAAALAGVGWLSQAWVGRSSTP
jgi:hypothetical protein